MNPTIEINERVDMVVLYRKGVDLSMFSMPYKMRWKDQEITFTKLGLRHPTTQRKRMIHVFDLSDGVNDYRLEYDAERLIWMLICMIPGDAG